MLESLLKGALNFLWDFPLNDWLVLVIDGFGKNTCGFAYDKIVLFFILYHAIDQNLQVELGTCESLLHEFLMDRLDCRSLLSNCYRAFISLLPELAYGVQLPSQIVC